MDEHGPSRVAAGGFTLIELLIVMVVIGILASIAIPRLNITKIRAYRSSMISDLKTIATQQEIYHTNNFTYAPDMATLEAPRSEGVSVTINEAGPKGWAAVATHAGVSTGQCGVFYGDASAANGQPATERGMVACDF